MTQNREMLMDQAKQCRIINKHSRQLVKLQSSTHFSNVELESMLMIYHKLTKGNTMDKKLFRHFLHMTFGMTDETLTTSMFTQFDVDKTFGLSYENWCNGMSIFLRGTLKEKMQFAFKTYDVLGVGYLTRESIHHLLKRSLLSVNEDSDEFIKDLCDVLFKKFNVNHESKVIRWEEFEKTVEKNNNMVEALGPILPSREAVNAFLSSFAQNVGRF